MKVRVEKQIGHATLVFETGFLAKQADAAVVVSYGETMVLNTAVTGAPRPGIDFFPLMCDYRERTSAAGKFPGGFKKREGPPSTKETLTSRLMDRPIRPLFPEWFKDEVQCQSIVLSHDGKNDPDVLAMNGCAAALHISKIPFNGPLAAVRVGRVDGKLVAFPSGEDLEESDLDLIVSGNKKSVLMIEGFARAMPEDEMMEALNFAHDLVKEVCDLHQELYDKVGVVKGEYVAPPDSGLYDRVKNAYYDQLRAAQQTPGKQARADAVRELKDRVVAELIPDPSGPDAVPHGELANVWDRVEQRVVRDLILGGTRSDGRDRSTVRDIHCEVGVLPRTHGSAVFQRGETQALISVTLGTGRDEQRVDTLFEEYSKKFMLDYNFPPFSVGEAKPIRGPGRREIGHGALAERSVNPVLPPVDKFPYTVRVISDILESNGSSSMASVCGATLGLMDAGVPISDPVAGISIGLVKESDEQWVLLTDILGNEDHHGDMDFKIAGTQRGITGIQLDLKIDGIHEEIIRQTLAQAREARIHILRQMLSAIREPRTDISAHAPRLLRTKIEPDKIGALIGPGGKNIRHIQESTGTVIEVDDDGWVTVASTNREWAEAALAQIEACTATVQIGKIYNGRVASVKDFGAFVEILPGRDGLCHISELSSEYVSSVTDVCNVGDELKVLVIDIDDHDRVKLSRKRALQELGLPDDRVPAGAGGGGGGGGERGGGDRGGGERGGGDRGRRDRGDRGGRGRRN
ncbi:MAG: polyribonucleotide nucleotidyltransferase [Planctomycetes bacterium]|nr:polyribonucleotide nucleotidyltransferase [Planctomycetota bacterium]